MHCACSVVICTRNPRLDYLSRALMALKEQGLPMIEWELLLIDNASQNPLQNLVDLSWHPTVRIVREPEPGLTPARLPGDQAQQALHRAPSQPPLESSRVLYATHHNKFRAGRI